MVFEFCSWQAPLDSGACDHQIGCWSFPFDGLCDFIKTPHSHEIDYQEFPFDGW
jgi:hypothetical protein